MDVSFPLNLFLTLTSAFFFFFWDCRIFVYILLLLRLLLVRVLCSLVLLHRFGLRLNFWRRRCGISCRTFLHRLRVCVEITSLKWLYKVFFLFLRLDLQFLIYFAFLYWRNVVVFTFILLLVKQIRWSCDIFLSLFSFFCFRRLLRHGLLIALLTTLFNRNTMRWYR